MAGGEEFAHIFRDSGHDDDGNRFPPLMGFYLPVKLDPRFFRHGNIQGDEVGGIRFDLLPSLLSILGQERFEPLIPQEGGKISADVFLIVDDQNFFPGSHDPLFRKVWMKRFWTWALSGVI